MVGLCPGAFPVAQAGLLDGRSAATHWAAAGALAQLYPRVKVNEEVLYVDQGDVLTSAGVAAGLDFCLHLLRQLCGAEIANRVARRLLIAPHRDGSQAQFIEHRCRSRTARSALPRSSTGWPGTRNWRTPSTPWPNAPP